MRTWGTRRAWGPRGPGRHEDLGDPEDLGDMRTCGPGGPGIPEGLRDMRTWRFNPQKQEFESLVACLRKVKGEFCPHSNECAIQPAAACQGNFAESSAPGDRQLLQAYGTRKHCNTETHDAKTSMRTFKTLTKQINLLNVFVFCHKPKGSIMRVFVEVVNRVGSTYLSLGSINAF